jgi:hypothetical protein
MKSTKTGSKAFNNKNHQLNRLELAQNWSKGTLVALVINEIN